MLNHISNKGVITDHVEKKNRKNLENLLIYGVFRLQVEKIKIFENIFSSLKTLISRSNLNWLSSSFFLNIHISCVENDSAIENWGHR